MPQSVATNSSPTSEQQPLAHISNAALLAAYCVLVLLADSLDSGDVTAQMREPSFQGPDCAVKLVNVSLVIEHVPRRPLHPAQYALQIVAARVDPAHTFAGRGHEVVACPLCE